MRESEKTKSELLKELAALRARLAELQNECKVKPKPPAASDDHYRQRYERLRTNIPVGLFVSNQDGKLLSANPALVKMLKYDSEEQMLNTPAANFYPDPADRDRFLRQIRNNGAVTDFETRCRCKDGSIIWVSLNAFSFRDENDTLCFKGIVRDITRYKQTQHQLTQYRNDLERLVAQRTAELENTNKALEREIARHTRTVRMLRQSEREWRTLVETMNSGLAVLDEEGAITFVNEKLCEMLGYKAEEMLGRDAADFVDPSCLDLYNQQTARRSQTKKGTYELTMTHKNGSKVPVLVCARAIFDDDERYLGNFAVITDITELKKVEQALHESETNWRSLTENAPNIICTVDREGTVLFLNRTISGIPTAEVVGNNAFDFTLPEYQERSRKALEQVFETGQPQTYEVKAVMPDGKRNWFLINAGPVKEGGEVVAATLVASDITKIKNAETEIKNASLRNELILNTSIDGFIVVNLDGTIAKANPAFCEMLGYTEQELCEMSLAQLEAKEHPEEVKQHIDLIVRQGYDRFETRHRHKDGGIVDVEVSSRFCDFGQNKFFFSFCRDITERKRLTRLLTESEEKYRTLVESAGEAITTMDANGVFLFMNTTAAKRLGGRPEDFIGKTVWELFPKRLAESHVANIRRVIETSRPETIEQISEVSGEPRWYRTTITPLRDSQGRITAAMVVARDIHEQKENEQQLQRYRKHAACAERLASLDSVTAFVAHELNQPLTVIGLLLADVLGDLQKKRLPRLSIVQNLQDCLRECTVATEIINRLRSFAGRRHLDTGGEIDIHRIATQLSCALADEASRAGLRIVVKNTESIPKYRGDAAAVEQLFFVLVKNAIEAADGQAEHTLVIDGRAEGGQVKLEFGDDCRGIEPENLDKVFEPFFTTKPAGQSSGLGLTIAKRVVLNLGGDIRLESQPGKGTTFFVTLPIETST